MLFIPLMSFADIQSDINQKQREVDQFHEQKVRYSGHPLFPTVNFLVIGVIQSRIRDHCH